jgi:carbonyl reductase 1
MLTSCLLTAHKATLIHLFVFVCAADLTTAKLTANLQEFAASVARNTVKEDGWHDSAYGMSKIGVSALTEIQARENKVKGLLVNACCPGWTITEMSGGKGNKTAAQVTIVSAF